MTVTEKIDLTDESMRNLVKCSYYFMRNHLPGFSVAPDVISDSNLQGIEDITSLYELVGNLFLEQIECYWVGELAQGDCVVGSVQIIRSAYETLMGLSSEATVSLMDKIWPSEFNNRREACWIIGNILTNEVINHAIEEEVSRNAVGGQSE